MSKLLNQGSISELILKRSILKHIKKNSKEVEYGAVIGNDFASFNDTLISHGSADSRLKPESLSMSILEMAYLRAVNNMYTSGARPKAIHILIQVPPEGKEQQIRYEMERINMITSRDKVHILGGHTEVTSSVNEFVANITCYGDKNEAIKGMQVKAGNVVVMAGDVGMMGTAILAAAKRDELVKRFAPSYIKGAELGFEDILVKEKAEIAKNAKAIYMHDISNGGLYGSLSNMAVKFNLGIKAFHDRIPVKQETIEICEYFKLNPYMLMGNGALLSVYQSMDEANEAVKMYEESGIMADVVGEITAEKERIVAAVEFDMRRNITPPDGDELYKVIVNTI